MKTLSWLPSLIWLVLGWPCMDQVFFSQHSDRNGCTCTASGFSGSFGASDALKFKSHLSDYAATGPLLHMVQGGLLLISCNGNKVDF